MGDLTEYSSFPDQSLVANSTQWNSQLTSSPTGFFFKNTSNSPVIFLKNSVPNPGKFLTLSLKPVIVLVDLSLCWQPQ